MNTQTPAPLLTILDTHPDWVAINKHIGISMHSEGDMAGLVVIAARQLNTPLWPVHRLDKVTSGVLLLARSSTAAARLSALFAEHAIQKYYIAQSQGKPRKKQGWIKGDMSKGRNGSWLLQRSTNKPAITRFCSHFAAESDKRLFLLMPLTGKTHQLRVAMKSLGCPIEGDSRYSGSPSDRTYLHAMTLCWQDADGSHVIHCPPESGHWSPLLAGWHQPQNLLKA